MNVRLSILSILAPVALASFAAGAGSPLSAQGSAQSEEGSTGTSEETLSDTDATFDATFDAAPETTLTSRMSEDQFIAFFSMFAQNEEMSAALRPTLDAMLEKGETVENWQEQGIDILAEFAKLEGGLAANLLREEDREVLGVTDFSGTIKPDLEGFDSYALRPEPVGLVAERSFISYLPDIWFETSMQRSQQGTALCYGGYFGVTLHTRVDYRRWSEAQLIGIASLFAIVDKLAALDYCTIYSRDDEGRYLTRSVLSDGTDLPAINAAPDPSVAMPASKIESFLKTVPRPDFND